MSKEDNDNDTENYNNDEEYHFAVEPDTAENGLGLDAGEDEGETQGPSSKSKFNLGLIKEYFDNNIQVRNALIAIVVIFGFIIIYQLVTSKSSSSKTASDLKKTAKQQTVQAKPQQKIASFPEQTKVTKPTSSTSSTSEASTLRRNLTKVEQSQDTIKSKVSSLSAETSKLNTEYEALLEKVKELSMQMEKLTDKLDDQSNLIMTLNERRHAPVRHSRSSVQHKTYLKYNVQAVIPGRAWLIGANGSTLTVRKGSMIPGYGVVTFIDASQGRVHTNSGRDITFAQNDS